ncbi:AraC family transcriptional regulator [Flaviaesturariibacter flavus]|uniref:AraC family transcriptional regulator n=1 Tax=Flaviaesturariibacter flavus TaxID=2502780 RepID=A0A4R1BPS5_9BACT|nr:AraC family transcriptional regulator [Flaviaesturariibacter flavus]TCJ19235.1 AraC family transcriptional regulator [Flaviaesturariibacter flavus]
MLHQQPEIYLYPRVVQAKMFIDANYADPIDLKQIAAAAHFSRFHFLRLFRRIYGRTPNQYLVLTRIRAAARLLEAGRPVVSACHESGFASAATFATLFRKHRGITPSAFRAAALRRNAALKAQPLAFVPACFSDRAGWNRNFEEGS